jgi:hypothetical protein
MPAYAKDRRKYCGKSSIAASETATVSAEKRTVRPAVRRVVPTAVNGSAPADSSSRKRRTMKRA